MKILENEPLDRHTTVKIGGIARRLLIPESPEELRQTVLREKPSYYLGGGSNLLIADREFDLVLDLGGFDAALADLGGGKFRAGASLRLQSLIRGVNEAGYGGIEYLYSVPGLVGGAIVMNAGRGRQRHQSIADYVVSVEVLRGGDFLCLPAEACGFSHRHSLFRDNGDIVVSATLQFPEMSPEASQKAREDRLAWCRKTQDASAPNFGTVFCEKNARIMERARRGQWGGKAHFSPKTPNWIVNEGGSYAEAIGAIRKVERLHRLFFQKCRREVVVWE